MYNLDFSKNSYVHFTGIGGISMSALAEILLSKGFRVSGSDTRPSNITKHLISLGAEIKFHQVASNISKDINLLVHTAAVNIENPELATAKALGIPILSRAEFLGQIMKNYDIAIGVSGTHGKTTTTSLLAQILLDGDVDPTILVGGMFSSIGGNIKIGHSQTFLTEACEYANSFLSFAPTIGVILNVKEDHMDFFKDIDDIRNSFRKYVELIPKHGALVINSEIDDLSYFTENLECNVITYGIESESSTYNATNITYNELAWGSYDLMYDGKCLGRIDLKVPGEHNVSNSLSAIATAMNLGLSFETAKAGLASFTGTDRRFQHKGTIHGINIIDDYAHHPDEIKATLTAAKNYPHRKIWCVFQPHTYTRTNAFLKDFAQTLSMADEVVLTDIYAAREVNTLGISSKDLQTEIENLAHSCSYFSSFDEIENFLLENCTDGDLLITMGAGDVVLIGEKLLGL